MDTKKQNPPASRLKHQVHKISMQVLKNTKGTAINTQKSSAKNRTAPKRYPKEPRYQSSTFQPIIGLARLVVLLIVSFLCPFRFFAELFSVLIAVPLVLL